jgi:hypothetical protein
MLANGPTAGRLASRRPVTVARLSSAALRPARRSVRVLAAKVAGKPVPASAKQAVEEGLVAFNERKDYAEALRLFTAAMDLKPSEEEAIAALYNAGCAHAKRKEWQQATDAILKAVNDYKLKLSVALQVRVAESGLGGTAKAVVCARCCAFVVSGGAAASGNLPDAASLQSRRMMYTLRDQQSTACGQHIVAKRIRTGQHWIHTPHPPPTRPPTPQPRRPTRTKTSASSVTRGSGWT